jgi:DNA-binding transcriptional LysR family regulator
VDEGGFRKATEKLNYTQSTITFQISQMEQELSVRLFEKVGRRMALTKAGEWLIPYADEILQSVDKLRYFEDDLSKCRGDIQIGIGETLLCYLLPPVLKEFHRQAPDNTVPVPFIINEPNCIFRQIFEQYLRESAILLDHTIELWSIPTIKNLVKSDVGVSFLPAFTVQNELISGSLEEIPTRLTGRTITAVCAHHKNKWLSPLMQLFIELCTAILT